MRRVHCEQIVDDAVAVEGLGSLELEVAVLKRRELQGKANGRVRANAEEQVLRTDVADVVSDEMEAEAAWYRSSIMVREVGG